MLSEDTLMRCVVKGLVSSKSAHCNVHLPEGLGTTCSPILVTCSAAKFGTKKMGESGHLQGYCCSYLGMWKSDNALGQLQALLAPELGRLRAESPNPDSGVLGILPKS